MFLAFRNGQKERERKKRKNYRRKRLEEGSNHRPINRKSLKPSAGPRGTRRLLAVEELIFFFRWFSFEFVLALGAHPAWNNFIIPSKHVKTLKQGSSAEFSGFRPRDRKRSQWNKSFLNTSIFSCCIESRCTEKNQARSMMTSTHASVRCSILVFTDIHRVQPRDMFCVHDQTSLVTLSYNNVDLPVV